MKGAKSSVFCLSTSRSPLKASTVRLNQGARAVPQANNSLPFLRLRFGTLETLQPNSAYRRGSLPKKAVAACVDICGLLAGIPEAQSYTILLLPGCNSEPQMMSPTKPNLLCADDPLCTQICGLGLET